ncbi:MAG: hypothetical protein B7Z22_08375 [Hyphomonas sp. 32-62-5]|nr:MAG: hypothetical protein B7Z22_08375 [Hyphomonas sp. 32-62-5]
MAHIMTPEPVEDGQKSETSVAENGTDRSNVTPISPRAARELEVREGRVRAEEIFQGQLDQVLSEELSKSSADKIADPMFELFMLKRQS